MTELKNRMVVLLFLFGLVNYCTAQYINRTLTPQSSVSSFGSCMLHNADTTWIYGFKRDSSGLPYNVLLSLDELGEIQQELNYGIPGREVRPQYKAMVRQDGFFYLGLSSRVNDDTAYSHLYKCTPVGDTVWTRQYGAATGQFILYSIISHPEGGFVLLGIVKEELANESDIFILRTDTAGNELWRKVWGMPGRSEEIFNIVPLENEEYIGSGAIINFPPNYPSDNIYYSGLLVKFKNNNTVKSQIRGRPLNSEWVPGNLLLTPDYTVLFPSYVSDDLPNSDLRKGVLVEIDTSLEIISENVIDPQFNSLGFGKLERLPDGSMVFLGGVGSGTIDHKALLQKTTESGEIAWKRIFQFENLPMNFLSDFIVLPDGFALAGQVQFPQKIWFVRTDEYGCLIPGCQYIGVEEASSPNFAVRVYPNPASDLLYIFNPSSDDLPARLIDLGGKAVKTELMLPAGGTFILPLSELPAGIYFLRVNLPGGRYLTEKIVKQ